MLYFALFRVGEREGARASEASGIDSCFDAWFSELKIVHMQMVKIKFTDPARRAEWFVALAKRVRVICFADDIYEIPKTALSILGEAGIGYQVLAEEGFDRACRALRNPVAPKI